MVASDLLHASDGDSNTQHLLPRCEDTSNDTAFSEDIRARNLQVFSKNVDLRRNEHMISSEYVLVSMLQRRNDNWEWRAWRAWLCSIRACYTLRLVPMRYLYSRPYEDYLQTDRAMDRIPFNSNMDVLCTEAAVLLVLHLSAAASMSSRICYGSYDTCYCEWSRRAFSAVRRRLKDTLLVPSCQIRSKDTASSEEIIELFGSSCGRDQMWACKV